MLPARRSRPLPPPPLPQVSKQQLYVQVEQAGRLRKQIKERVATASDRPRVSDARSPREYRPWESPSWRKSVCVCVVMAGAIWSRLVGLSRGAGAEETRQGKEIDKLRHFEIGSAVPCKSFPNAAQRTHAHTHRNASRHALPRCC